MVKALPHLTAILLLTSCGGEDDVRERPVTDDRFEELVGGSLFSDHDDNQLMKNHALARELERTLLEMDGVKSARVHLNLRDPSILSRDREAKSHAAILVVKGGGASPAKEEIQRFAARALPNLSPDRVTVLVRPPKAPETILTTVGPFEVEAASAGTLRLVLSILLGITILLALGLIAAGHKIRTLKKRDG